MDSRNSRNNNWILVDSTAHSNADSPYDSNRQVYATPSFGGPSTSRGSILSARHQHRDPEERISSINLLNDRIQRRVVAQYSIYSNSSTVGEEVERPRESREQRVVDEQFSYVRGGEKSSAEERLDRLIQHRNSEGEIDAVYEKRSIAELTSADYSPRRRRSTHLWESPKREDRRVREQIMREKSRRHRERERADSLDSGSTRMRRGTQHSSTRWQIPSESADNVSVRRMPTLRRVPQYYSSCDMCAFSTLKQGEFCPFCSRGIYAAPPPMYRPSAPPVTRRIERTERPERVERYSRGDLRSSRNLTVNIPPPPPRRHISSGRQSSMTIEPYGRQASTFTEPFIPGVQILSARSLKRSAPYINTWQQPIMGNIQYQRVPVPPFTRTQPRYTTHKVYPPMAGWRHRPAPWDHENAWQREQPHPAALRRTLRSPVFRYGAVVPEELYDYDVYAKARDKRMRQRKALAIAVALLALALVITAGVVLAAVNY